MKKGFVLMCVLAVILLNGCKKSEDPGAEIKEENGVPVEIMVLEARPVQELLTLTGTLEPIYAVDLIAEVSGRVEAVYKDPGDWVSTRDTLALIDDRVPKSEYHQAQAQVLSAETNWKIAKINLESDKELFESGDISKVAYERSLLEVKSSEAQLLAAKANLERVSKLFGDTRITSPISGLIARKNVSPGDMVSPGMMTYRVVDINQFKIMVGVSQSDIQRIQKGNGVQITVPGLHDQQVDGFVYAISPQADERTGSFEVEVHVKNTDDKSILGGMTAKVDLIISELGRQLVVPDHAIVQKNQKPNVYRIENMHAKLTPVDLGERIGSKRVVEKGVTAGDSIVVVGMKNLGMETRVWIEGQSVE